MPAFTFLPLIQIVDRFNAFSSTVNGNYPEITKLRKLVNTVSASDRLIAADKVKIIMGAMLEEKERIAKSYANSSWSYLSLIVKPENHPLYAHMDDLLGVTDKNLLDSVTKQSVQHAYQHYIPLMNKADLSMITNVALRHVEPVVKQAPLEMQHGNRMPQRKKHPSQVNRDRYPHNRLIQRTEKRRQQWIDESHQTSVDFITKAKTNQAIREFDKNQLNHVEVKERPSCMSYFFTKAKTNQLVREFDKSQLKQVDQESQARSKLRK